MRGKLDGRMTGWDRSGRKWLETDYTDGRINGDDVWYYENGVTNRIEHFVNEHATGRWLHFYRDGKKWEERFFSAPGVPDGDETVWNTNGVVSFTHRWQAGKPFDGAFTMVRGSNLFRDEYRTETLVNSTNLGPSWQRFALPALQTNAETKK